MTFVAAAVAATAFFMPSLARAQQAAPLFASDQPIQISISAPISTLTRNRALGTTVSGTLTDPAGQSLPVSLSVRSTTRRNSDVCDFPPLRVSFGGRAAPTSLFAGQNRLKLVTHCGNGAGAQQYELLEYAAYRMLNQLTPRSFRVRLASIDYRDPAGRPIVTRYGFFIEPLKDLARRNGTRPLQASAMIPIQDLSATDSARYALFQHMIANHDWSMRAPSVGKACCHNAEMLGSLTPGGAIPVPYDFDYSGMVGAPYAVPPEQLRISNVKQRFYRGYCVHNAQAMAVAQQFRAAQPQMLGVLAQTPGLEPRTIQRATSFLNGFFSDIATDQDVSAKVLKRCAG
jgi:hypothetical protein